MEGKTKTTNCYIRKFLGNRGYLIRGIREMLQAVEYDEFDILGKEALFSEDGFIIPEHIANDVYVYWLRGSFDNGTQMSTPITVESEPMLFDRYGCILTKEPLDLGEDGARDLEGEEWGFVYTRDEDECDKIDIYSWFGREEEEESEEECENEDSNEDTPEDFSPLLHGFWPINE